SSAFFRILVFTLCRPLRCPLFPYTTLFRSEASHQRRILEQLRLEHLERHRPLKREVAGPVHLAHPALPDEIVHAEAPGDDGAHQDRKSTRLNSSHQIISYAVFCLKKKNTHN